MYEFQLKLLDHKRQYLRKVHHHTVETMEIMDRFTKSIMGTETTDRETTEIMVRMAIMEIIETTETMEITGKVMEIMVGGR